MIKAVVESGDSNRLLHVIELIDKYCCIAKVIPSLDESTNLPSFVGTCPIEVDARFATKIVEIRILMSGIHNAVVKNIVETYAREVDAGILNVDVVNKIYEVRRDLYRHRSERSSFTYKGGALHDPLEWDKSVTVDNQLKHTTNFSRLQASIIDSSSPVQVPTASDGPKRRIVP